MRLCCERIYGLANLRYDDADDDHDEVDEDDNVKSVSGCVDSLLGWCRQQQYKNASIQ